MIEDVPDSLFHGCAFAAYLDQAAADCGPPDPERTRRRAFRYYEAELAAKNRRRGSHATLDRTVEVRYREGFNPPTRRHP